jgi:hypothetical protein
MIPEDQMLYASTSTPVDVRHPLHIWHNANLRSMGRFSPVGRVEPQLRSFHQ